MGDVRIDEGEVKGVEAADGVGENEEGEGLSRSTGTRLHHPYTAAVRRGAGAIAQSGFASTGPQLHPEILGFSSPVCPSFPPCTFYLLTGVCFLLFSRNLVNSLLADRHSQLERSCPSVDFDGTRRR
jgi:hypothetical protein